MSIFAAPSFYNQRDQDIYNQGFFFQPQEMFSDGVYTPPTTTNMGGAAAATGINTVLNQSGIGGGGGGGVPFSGTATDLTTAFQKAVDDRQNRLNDPSDRFLGFKTMRDLPATEASSILAENIGIPQEQTFAGKVQDFLTPQSADEIMAEGYQEPSFQPGIVSAFLGKVDRFRTLPRPDQAFIAANMGYTGPTVFGENTTGGSKDPFGLNVRSAFGNYAERVGIEATKLGDSLSGRLTDKYQDQFGITDDEELSYDPITGKYIGTNAAAVAKANAMTRLMRTKQQYYLQKTKERNELREQEKKRQEEAFQAQLKKEQRERRQQDLATIESAYDRFSRGDDSAYASGEAGIQKDSSGTEVGYNDPFDPGGGEKDGGFIDGTNRRMDFMMGGLADLVDIYD